MLAGPHALRLLGVACRPPAKAAPATAIVVVPRRRRREKIPPARLNPLGRPANSLSDMKISFAGRG
jgi:hypothetical protein